MAYIFTAIPSGDRDPESPVTPELIDGLYFNPFAIMEKATGAPVLANDYIVTAMIEDGAVTVAKLQSASVGNYCIMTGALIKISSSLTYPSVQKIAEIIVGRQSAMRIRFTSNESGANGAVYWRLYKNGVYQSVQNYCYADTNVETSFDVTGLVSGDLIQLYLYPDAGTSNAVGTISNLRICYDKPIDGGSLYF